MGKYIVTDEDGELRREYPNQPAPVWAFDAEDAATMWAEEAWPHVDYPDEMTCLVTSPGETEPVRYTVTVEREPVFSASKS